MDRLEKELRRIQQKTSEMIRNLTSCHRNTFDNSVSTPIFQNFGHIRPPSMWTSGRSTNDRGCLVCAIFFILTILGRF